ncbi:MAG: hypothetical protein ACREX3_04185 [Gammaproteobacteria bacterium]
MSAIEVGGPFVLAVPSKIETATYPRDPYCYKHRITNVIYHMNLRAILNSGQSEIVLIGLANGDLQVGP